MVFLRLSGLRMKLATTAFTPLPIYYLLMNLLFDVVYIVGRPCTNSRQSLPVTVWGSVSSWPCCRLSLFRLDIDPRVDLTRSERAGVQV